ncbi:MAG TPA: DUF1461 domain-containing protein [Patescibacteria group bacterium]|nr:DUF1461 domain-containing protein [Patescibacteria group bacterium]
MKRWVVTLSLVLISFWWTFVIIWQPGVVHFVARLTYPDTAASQVARERAIQYSQLGSSGRNDIFFTANELAHLDDVSKIYKPLSFVLNFATILSWGILLLAVHQKNNLRVSLNLASKILAGIVGLGLISVLLFTNSFVLFHEVLFPAGNWAFPASSYLIAIFPEIFWRLELVVIVLLLSAFSLVYRLLALYGINKEK